MTNYHYLILVLFFTACTNKNSNINQKSKSSAAISKNKNTVYMNLGSEPVNLHPIRSSDAYASNVQKYVLDTLLTRNLDTYQHTPHLAKKWTVNKDNTVFTFTIRSNVKWHDGRPLTVQDVAFSFKAVKDPSYGGIFRLPYYENIQSVKILNSHTVQFTAKKKYFNTLASLASLYIIPAHIYEDKNKKKINHILVGSGPYILQQYKRGKKIVLEQNKNWWGHKLKPNEYRIPRIIFRFIHHENDQIMRMGAGQLDVLLLSAEAHIKKTNTSPWGTSILKKEVQQAQSGYGFIGWNLNHPFFKDKKTRRALNYLMNRKLINQKLYYGKNKLATGPWFSWSDYADPSVLPILFNPKKARQLLTQAGWNDTDKNGILDKVILGKKTEFKFKLIFSNKDTEKVLTIYQQDLKNNGIIVSLQLRDFTALLKIINEKKMEAFMLGWSGGSIDIDPKQIWHSQSAQKGGSNFIAYSNPDVDRLIDKGRVELNRNKRIKIFQKVYRLIADDSPYLFLFNKPHIVYSYSQKLKITKDTYRYGIGQKFWNINQNYK